MYVQPETVAAYLVPRVRTVVARQAASTYIKYLTIPRALGKFLTAPTKANKYFNKQGERKSCCYMGSAAQQGSNTIQAQSADHLSMEWEVASPLHSMHLCTVALTVLKASQGLCRKHCWCHRL